MTIEALRTVAFAVPFRPFTLSLVDERRFRVRGPEFLVVPSQAQRTFTVMESRDDYSVIDLLMVASIDFGRIGFKPRRRPR